VIPAEGIKIVLAAEDFLAGPLSDAVAEAGVAGCVDCEPLAAAL
jgi:hypothetical protein